MHWASSGILQSKSDLQRSIAFFHDGRSCSNGGALGVSRGDGSDATTPSADREEAALRVTMRVDSETRNTMGCEERQESQAPARGIPKHAGAQGHDKPTPARGHSKVDRADRQT